MQLGIRKWRIKQTGYLLPQWAFLFHLYSYQVHDVGSELHEKNSDCSPQRKGRRQTYFAFVVNMHFGNIVNSQLLNNLTFIKWRWYKTVYINLWEQFLVGLGRFTLLITISCWIWFYLLVIICKSLNGLGIIYLQDYLSGYTLSPPLCSLDWNLLKVYVCVNCHQVTSELWQLFELETSKML